jgi:hypothetical protein
MTGHAESNSGFSFGWPVGDGPIELTPEQESQVVRWAEGFTELQIPSGMATPEIQSMFPQFVVFMQRVWQGREMPAGVVAFVSRFGS